MPTPKLKTAPLPQPALVHEASTPRPAPVPPLPELATLTHELAELRADLARTVAEQIEAEKGNRFAPAELLGSKAILERRIAEAERNQHKLHRAQAQANYEADADTWAELQRQRALTVLALRRINRELDARRMSYFSGGQHAEAPISDDAVSYMLLGLDLKRPGRTGLAAAEFLRRCVREGFITMRELRDDDDGFEI